MTTDPHAGDPILAPLHEMLGFTRPTQIVDIGANPIDGDPPYKPLLRAGLCRVVGFEPQGDALARLNQEKSAFETYLPYAVGDGTTRVLNLCSYPGWTSILVPSQASLNVFSAFQDNARVLQQVPIATFRLDDIAEVEQVDFLKIDIQGGELDVFRNATTKLARCVAIQTEVSFVNLYDGQPGFGALDVELRQQGFIPHCFAAIKKGMIAPFMLNNDPWQPLNQLLEADLVYVRDFRDPAALDDHQLRHLCLIAHACYQSFDLAFRCLLILRERGAIADGSGQRYIDLLNAARVAG